MPPPCRHRLDGMKRKSGFIRQNLIGQLAPCSVLINLDGFLKPDHDPNRSLLRGLPRLAAFLMTCRITVHWVAISKDITGHAPLIVLSFCFHDQRPPNYHLRMEDALQYLEGIPHRKAIFALAVLVFPCIRLDRRVIGVGLNPRRGSIAVVDDFNGIVQLA